MAKKPLNTLITAIQKLCVTVCLFLIYILVFGFIKAAAFAFDRKSISGKKDEDSMWETAQGYDNDLAELKRGS